MSSAVLYSQGEHTIYNGFKITILVFIIYVNNHSTLYPKLQQASAIVVSRSSGIITIYHYHF